MPRKLTLNAPRSLSIIELPRRALGHGEIRLESIMSAISHGTEMNLYRGTSAFSDRRFDPNLRLFVNGGGAGSGFPMELGYELVSRVVEVGPGVDGIAVGDLVHTTNAHADETIVEVEKPSWLGYPMLKIPDGVAPEQALFIALSCVGLVAVHDADIKLGDIVVVFGLGVVGLLIIQLARLQGAGTVLGVDPLANRRSVALRVGADECFDPTASHLPAVVKRHLGENSADVSIETSGVDRALHDAIACVGIGGKIVSAAFYQGGAPALRLGEEWHHNRPSLVATMGVWDCPHREHPRWHRDRIAQTALSLIETGAVNTEGFITHWFDFTDAAKAYELVDKHPEETIKVALSYASAS